MLSFKDAAFKVLLEAKRPLNYIEITQKVLEDALVETVGRTPERTLHTDISRDIRNLGIRSRFVRVAKGVYGINGKYIEQQSDLVNAQKGKLLGNEIKESFTSEHDTIRKTSNNLYTGKAGEYVVAGELLFRSYNISLMSVDEGIDIIASKNNKTFNIQVKTSHVNQFNRYISDIRISSFEKHNDSNTFYIFVLRQENGLSNFLIFPYHKIKELVDTGIISRVNSNTRYRVNFSVKDGSIYIGSHTNDVTYHHNNWQLVT